MKHTILLIAGIFAFALYSFAQVNELEKLRAEMVLFVQYDNNKVDSIPKNVANTNRLKKNLENAFITFALNKNSKDLDNLKQNSINNKSDYIIGNHNYFFQNQRRDMYVKSLENNVNYAITFYGLYDYKLSNFVSIYIQPFTVDTKKFLVYYYKLNGVGTYYIKDSSSNAFVFKSEALTSNAAILSFNKLDKNHFLLVEDMGDNGQRALVVDAIANNWKTVNAFKGKAFVNSTNDYAKMIDKSNRTYLRFAKNRAIATMYGYGFLKKYELQFDEASKTISYKEYNKNETEVKTFKAKWENNMFTVDDYYIGKDLNDQDLPIP